MHTTTAASNHLLRTSYRHHYPQIRRHIAVIVLIFICSTIATHATEGKSSAQVAHHDPLPTVHTDILSLRGQRITQAFHRKLVLADMHFDDITIRETLLRTDRSHCFFYLNERVFYDEVVFRTRQPDYFDDIAQRAYQHLVKAQTQLHIQQRL